MKNLDHPSMRLWEKAWHEADAVLLKAQYAAEALVFPPGKSAVKGNETILGFFKGGLGKVDVRFEAQEIIVKEAMAFESGLFRDFQRGTENTTGTGHYSMTWLWEDNQWRIKCHTWTVPH